MIKINKIYLYAMIVAVTSTTSGQSVQDLKKLREAINREQDIPRTPTFDNELDLNLPQNAQLKKIVPPKDSLHLKSKFFGYDFFTKRDSLSLWDNLPVTANYILSPGDEVILTLWGETQLRKKYTIDK